MKGNDAPLAIVENVGLQIPALDIRVTPMTARETVNWIGEQSSRSLVLNHNLHSAYLHAIDAKFRDLYMVADRVLIDGAPILWLARGSKAGRGLSSAHRIGSTDWIARLNELGRPLKVAIFGGTHEVNQRAVDSLASELAGTGSEVSGRDGYSAWEGAVDWLREAQPDLVLVGLGMPLQERFLAEHWAQLPAAVYATVGGAVDYIAGTNRLAPRMVGRLGLEWLWRLAHEPRRLGHRYLVEPCLLLAEVRKRRRAAPASHTEEVP